MFRIRKGQPGNPQLPGKLPCQEVFIPGYEKQIKPGLLPVAQEKIFTDHRTKLLIHIHTVFHCHCRIMVNTVKGYAQRVQKVVGMHLFFLPPGFIHGPAFLHFHFILLFLPFTVWNSYLPPIILLHRTEKVMETSPAASVAFWENLLHLSSNNLFQCRFSLFRHRLDPFL